MSRREPTFRRLFRLGPTPVEQDVDDELALHLELTEERLRRQGFSEREAHEEALRRFGDLAKVRAACVALDKQKERKMRWSDVLNSVIQDGRFAARSLRRSPGFALVALLTLALGIGANTAIFSVVRGVLLRPLPFPEPERLVRIWPTSQENGVTRGALSPVDLEDWRARQRTFEELGGYWYAEGMTGVDLSGDGEPERVPAAYVTGGLFPTLRTPPMLGRPIQPEDQSDGHASVVVLSHRLWTHRFGSDPNILGRSLTIDGEPMTVIGVMPAGFAFPTDAAQLWLPTASIGERGIPRARQVRWLAVLGRLRPGVALETARADLGRIARELEAEFPATNGKWNDVAAASLRDATVGSVKPALLVLLGAVALILLIACANIANLLLARSTVRERELAVRAALGASPPRLIRQLLTESALLAFVGGLLGLAVARSGADALIALASGQLPRVGEIQMDGTVLLFALGASLGTAVLFGLLPALRAAAPQLQSALKSAGGGGAGHRGSLRSALVVVEVALAVVLAAGAGVATRSLVNLLNVDPGFRPEGAAVLTFSVPGSRYDGLERRSRYLTQVLDAVRAAPGVEVAGATKALPLQGTPETFGVRLPDQPFTTAAALPQVHGIHVSTDYFRAIGTPLVQGRAFTNDDQASDKGWKIVVNESFVRRFFPDRDPIGQEVWLTNEMPMEVIGVVRDMKQVSLAEPPAPAFYLHYLQNSRSLINLVVRGKGDPMQLAANVRRAIWSVDSQQTITRITTLAELSGTAVAQPRLLAVLLGLFAMLGLVLGAVGIYGVLAYDVSQRSQEIGVRMALGARPGEVLRLVLRRGLTLALIGVVTGLAGAFGLSRVMQSVLYGVRAADPLAFALVAFVLFLVALAASYLPARRATRVDPATALRAQ